LDVIATTPGILPVFSYTTLTVSGGILNTPNVIIPPKEGKYPYDEI
jgi:hypothetical protein